MDVKKLLKLPRVLFILTQNVCHVFAYLVTTMVILYPLYLVNPKLYLKIENILYNFNLYTVASWSWTGNITVHEYGDQFDTLFVNKKSTTKKLKNDISDTLIKGEELSSESDSNKPIRLLVIPNHQESGDVPLMFQMFSCYPQNVLLWVMDAIFKKTHFGLVSWVHGDYFIKPRIFEPNHLTEHCLENTNKNTFILFPEGGFRYKRVESSHKYSDKMSLPKLRNVVWPRFGAFKDLTDKRLGITHIVDLTIIYPSLDQAISLVDILFGREPTPVYFIYRVYDLNEIEPNDEWLNELWKRKDDCIQRFYDDKQSFLKSETKIREVRMKRSKMLLINVIFFSLFAIYVYIIQTLLYF